MNAEPFRLADAPPKPQPATATNEQRRQSVLFAGMDCLPGQRDLFATDGQPEEKRPPTSA